MVVSVTSDKDLEDTELKIESLAAGNSIVNTKITIVPLSESTLVWYSAFTWTLSVVTEAIYVQKNLKVEI